jgi:anthranilate synthase/phosphoribosyltransferase
VLDTCGTGGDGIGTFNISSLAAVVAAACGARVAKHGNRAVSSTSGSADFFRTLGLPIDLRPEAAAELLERTGFAFLFAPMYHPAMKHAAQVRRELGMKTIMNLVGPLSNPAEATSQLIGVFAEGLCRPVAEAARLLGVQRAMVVHGLDGEDEVSVTGPTRVVELRDGEITEYLIDPAQFGIDPYPIEALQVASVEDNAAVARRLLESNPSGGRTVRGGGTAGGPDEHGSESEGAADRLAAIRDAVAINAGAALYVYGLAETIEAGFLSASQALANGAVRETLERIITEGRALADPLPASEPLQARS